MVQMRGRFLIKQSSLVYARGWAKRCRVACTTCAVPGVGVHLASDGIVTEKGLVHSPSDAFSSGLSPTFHHEHHAESRTLSRR
jgi:hypothetical protein